MANSFAREIDKFFCDFEDPNSCQWIQDIREDDFDWTRNQGHTKSGYNRPTADHTKSFGLLNKKQGPGSIRHGEDNCTNVHSGPCTRPEEGAFLVTGRGCGEDRLEFRLMPNGILRLTRYGMCVKPADQVTEGAQVRVFSSCDVTDTWNWTANRSLQYREKMCLKLDDVKLVLDSVCDKPRNLFEFVPTSGWYLYIEYIEASNQKPNGTARLISPSTTKAKSCLIFFYHMFGANVGELQVYVKSGGKMGLPVWRRSGDQGDKWLQAHVPANKQTASYKFVIEGVRGEGDLGHIAIDDISLMDSCPRDNNGSKKATTIFTVSTTPASSPSQAIRSSEGK
ncbi:MAM and LDL-receptor class A domain-containing 2-like [Paramuricea clavata]|uniref:MAM and LDL-receptor class A domain-containing 2-like n=1 Tax=Paramuricea clavata TaxID=317549 RepID=A0A7D9HUP4_PARCT|nr:MAM and LDL-receptor class A domain-containing 2-like [Paramuricea clavata]